MARGSGPASALARAPAGACGGRLRRRRRDRAAAPVTLATVDLTGLEAVPAPWLPCLPPPLRARLERLRRPQDRVSVAAAHVLLRLLLAAETGLPPARLRLEPDAAGKPRALDAPAPFLSLSHTDGMAAVVLAARRPVGVDVEALDRPPVAPDLLAAALGAGAVRRLGRRPEAARRRAFLTEWTGREAMMKADGRGLSLLDGNGLRLAPAGSRGRVTAPGGRCWHILRPTAGPDHVLALAVAAPGPVRHWRLPAAGLTAWAAAVVAAHAEAAVP